MLKVYIGHDPREQVAYDVAEHSLQSRASVPVCITPLQLEKNERWGLMRRPRNCLMDDISEAPMSTEFAISRFLTPFLAQTGWALFTDCDVVFLDDVARLLEIADPRYAVMCVKHEVQWPKGHAIKMDGQIQTSYLRKNWSSVMLFNCDHPRHRQLTLDVLNGRPGRDLHGFCWLKDEDIGELPAEWNWLVGVQQKPAVPRIAHFTLGGPWFTHWVQKEHDDIWKEALHSLRESQAPDPVKTTAAAA